MGASLGQLANSVCRGSGGVIWLTKPVNDQTTYATANPICAAIIIRYMCLHDG